MSNADNPSQFRVPPHSLEAERGVLGSILLDPMQSIARAQESGLQPASFFDRRNQALYKSLCDMLRANVPMDALTISEWLKDANQLDEVGGLDYLIELQEATLVPAHVAHYSEIVVEKKLYRDMIRIGAQMVEDAYECGEPAGKLLQNVPAKLARLMNEKRDADNQSVLDKWFKRMEAIKNGEIRNGLPLPWPALDEMLCGLQPGLIVIGARPSAGKTTMEVNICDFLAQQGIAGARGCLDMSHEQLLVRSVIRESRVSLPRLNRGYARWSQIETVRECKDLVARWPFHIITGRSLDGICTQARMLKLKHDIQYLTVDFLTQVHVDNWRGDRRNEIGKITATLKALAFDLDIPVILLSQLSRGSVKDSRPPRLDDLRESGDIEQDATQVLLVYKALPQDYADYDKESNPEPLPEDADRRYLRGTIFDLAKNQQGETGLVEMWMRPNYFRFQHAEPEFMDLEHRLSEFGQETRNDDVCDAAEPAVCDGDDEVDVEELL